MLNAHITTGQTTKPFWVDLLNPTAGEIAQVAADFAIQVPSRESLQEIETSSRLRAEGRTLYVSMPLTLQDEAAGSRPYRWDMFFPPPC